MKNLQKKTEAIDNVHLKRVFQKLAFKSCSRKKNKNQYLET